MRKKLKRKIKLKGRKICHGNTSSCKKELHLGIHRPFGKKTPKGTKPVKKVKKNYKLFTHPED